MTPTDKQAILEVSGNKYPVHFGVNYFVRYFMEATGVDLIQKGTLSLFEANIKYLEYTAAFIYAGHKAKCSLEEKECELTLDKANHLIYCLSDSEGYELFIQCFAVLLGVTVQAIKDSIKKAIDGGEGEEAKKQQPKRGRKMS